MALQDYLDRTVDLLAFAGAKALGEQQLTMSVIGGAESGEVCTGVQKLAQRWLIKFMKIMGTDPYDPNSGTEFMLRAKRGELRNQVDALVAFSEAQLDVRKQLRAEEQTTDPDDEKYASAVVQSLAVLPGQLKLYVRLTSVAGDSREIILPINITVR